MYGKVDKVKGIVRFLFTFIFLKKSYNFSFIGARVKFYKRRGLSIGRNVIIGDDSSILCDSHLDNEGQINLNDDVIISRFSIIRSHGGSVDVGSSVFIGERVNVQGRGGVEIGSGSMIAANSFISSSNHNISDPLSSDFLIGEEGKFTRIGNKVWVGCNCVVTAGVSIGSNSIVGGGSVVTKDVESYSMVAGNPAKVIKKYCLDRKKWLPV